MPPPRRKIKFSSRQRALRRKYSLNTEIKRFEAYLENTSAAGPSDSQWSMQAPTTAPSFAQSQHPGPATVSETPGEIDIDNAEPTGHSGTWEVTQVSAFLHLIA